MPDLTSLVAPAPRGGMMGGYYQALMQELQRQQGQQAVQKGQIENQYAPLLNMLKAQGMQTKTDMDKSHSHLYDVQADITPEKAKAYIASMLSNANYHNTQAGLAPEKIALEKKKWDVLAPYYARAGLTNLGKTVLEQANLDSSGNITNPIAMPQSGNGPQQMQLTPEQIEKLRGYYNLSLQKQVTDTDTRKRSLFATNVEKTMNMIDPNIFAMYSGPSGHMKLAADSAKSLAGQKVPEYKAYQNMSKAAQLAASQMRQFYGDSIQPSVREHLEQLAKPDAWNVSPEVAKSNFDFIQNIIGQEVSTYRNALQNSDVYQGKTTQAKTDSDQPQISPEQAKEILRKRGLIK
jgi:hypothetical protein